MNLRRIAGLWLCAGVTLFAGCGEQTPEQKKSPSPAVDTSDIKLKAVSHADFLKALKAQEGKVVVVDFWGSF